VLSTLVRKVQRQSKIDTTTYKKEFSEDNIKNCMEEIKISIFATRIPYCFYTQGNNKIFKT
jgi:hypothetical protein